MFKYEFKTENGQAESFSYEFDTDDLCKDEFSLINIAAMLVQMYKVPVYLVEGLFF